MKKNILNIIQCTNLGGMEWASLRLMNQIHATLGIRTSFISLSPKGRIATEIIKYGHYVNTLNYKKWYCIFNQINILIRLVSEITASNIIFITGITPIVFFSLFLSKTKNKVIIISTHYHHKNVRPYLYFKFMYWIACTKGVKLITFPSKYVFNEAVNIAPIIKPISMLLPNVIPNIQNHELKTEPIIKNNKFVLGNAGWLIQRKRFDVFIEVISFISNNYTDVDVHAVIAGDGPERVNLQALANALGVESRITWLGQQENLDDFYQSIDCLLFNTDFDNLPTTPIEAMCRGIPVVGSSLNGGLVEIIDDGKSGYFMNSHNTELLAQCCMKIYNGEINSSVVIDMINKKYPTSVTVDPIINILKNENFIHYK
jgi:glycosyltransferase involved in cell wall biosynthesis